MPSLTCRWIPHDSPAWRATVALRDRVLRAPLGLRFTVEELAAEHAQLHLAAYDGEALVGCLVLVPHPDGEIKMRQVAVEPARQRQGIGEALVRAAETAARARGCTRLTLHARVTAVPFYLRLGYALVGDAFIEVTVPHRAMEKRLQ